MGNIRNVHSNLVIAVLKYLKRNCIVKILGICRVYCKCKDLPHILAAADLLGINLHRNLLCSLLNLRGKLVRQPKLGKDGMHLGIILPRLSKYINNLPRGGFRPHRPVCNQYGNLLPLGILLNILHRDADVIRHYAALHDNPTVIADNLDHGIPIMRAGNHTFRLVTLEGDVMHSGGSMTGGSTQSKMVNLLGRERELKELTQRLQEGKAKLDAMKADLQQEQLKKNSLKLAVQEALNNLHQQEIAVARETEREDAAKAELSGHRARMEQTELATVQLQESIQQIDEQLESIGLLSGDAQLDQASMEEKTTQLQEALYAARQQTNEATDRVMTRTLQLSDLRHQLDILHKDTTRYEQDRGQILREMERRTEQLAAMDDMDQQDMTEIARTTVLVETRQLEQKRQEQVAQSLESRRAATQEKLRDVLTDMENLHQVHNRDADRVHRTELARSKVDSDLRVMQDRIWNSYEVTYAGAEEFRIEEGFDVVESDRRAAQLMSQIRALGNVNVNAVEEYANTKARYDELTTQQEDLRQAENDLRELINRLLEQMQTTFVENFSKLQVYFSETFTRLFGGGKAELSLMDPNDPLNCGIEVNAQPPGKKLQLLSLLSGGERALTAIAILFAMLKLKPTPFCILDEIEAALDDANIGYYADYLLEYSKGTQFIVVTHRKGTMERCNALYGVAMEEQGVSKMVSVSLQDYKE